MIERLFSLGKSLSGVFGKNNTEMKEELERKVYISVSWQELKMDKNWYLMVGLLKDFHSGVIKDLGRRDQEPKVMSRLNNRLELLQDIERRIEGDISRGIEAQKRLKLIEERENGG